MLEIFCPASPLVYCPIQRLLAETNYQINDVYDGLCMRLIAPFNKSYHIYKNESCLTNAQTKEDQIRFLSSIEIKNKLMHIARKAAPHITQTILFTISPHYKNAHHLIYFIKCLFLQSKERINTQIRVGTTGNKILAEVETEKAEALYFSEESQRMNNAGIMINYAKECANAGDYFSAINLLDSIKDLTHNDWKTALSIFDLLGMYHRLIGNSVQSEYFYQHCLKIGDDRQTTGVKYGLSMIYLRHHPKKEQDVEKAKNYLEEAYKTLLSEPLNDKIAVDRVFNRNGYALVQYRKGQILKAMQTVEEGIKTLQNINTDYSKFHQSVLYYNLFQCLDKLGKHREAVNTMEHLISLDPKFFFYHECLANYYCKIGDIEKAKDAVYRGIRVHHYYFLLGKINYLQDNLDEAATAFEEAYSRNPLDIASLFYLTTIYNIQGKYENTMQALWSFHIK